MIVFCIAGVRTRKFCNILYYVTRAAESLPRQPTAACPLTRRPSRPIHAAQKVTCFFTAQNKIQPASFRPLLMFLAIQLSPKWFQVLRRKLIVINREVVNIHICYGSRKFQQKFIRKLGETCVKNGIFSLKRSPPSARS